MMVDKFMVFDVESIGLHGEGFAVAWVVVNREGERLDEGCIACDPADCEGTDESRLWVGEHVPALPVTSPTKQHLRNHFWHEWRSWADQGAVLVADCAWPVEANFLSACVRLNHKEREWQGPYPLHDLASLLLALGADALAVTERLPDELPAHHPLMDARQSARQLVACLKAHNDGLAGCPDSRHKVGTQMQTLYAHTENHHPLPAYVNVSQDGGPDAPVTISVRQRGEDYAKTMTVHAGIARAMAETLAEKLNQPGSGG